MDCRYGFAYFTFNIKLEVKLHVLLQETIMFLFAESDTGKLVLTMLFEEGGTDMTEVSHILDNEVTYHVTSRSVLPREDTVTFSQHSNDVFPLPITIIMQDKTDKYTITLTSECGMDVRTYRILFIEESYYLAE